MTVAPGESYWIERGRNRVFSHFSDVLMFFALAYEGFTRRQGGVPKKDPVLLWRCHAIGVSLKFALGGMIEGAETGSVPDSIEFRLIPKERDDEDGNVCGMGGLTIGVARSAFALFSEQAIQWVKTNVSTNYNSWPAIANFARVVRNAVVHGGRITINDPNAPIVTWRGIQFGPGDNGKEIISEGMLGPCDLLLLMLDLEGELDSLGAPFDLG